MPEIQFIIEDVYPHQIKVDKPLFQQICKQGCRVFGTKWSCPPASPTFLPGFPHYTVIILWAENDIQSKNEYTKVKAINSILKSCLYKFINAVYPLNGCGAHSRREHGIYGSGSCRMCKKCAYPDPCKHSDNMIYSLESVGIDVQDLCKQLGHELHWYKKGQKTPYKYGTVVGMVGNGNAEEIRNYFSKTLSSKPSLFD